MQRKKNSFKIPDNFILTINCGSSSIKYLLYDYNEHLTMAEGVVERIGIQGSFITHNAYNKQKYKQDENISNHSEAIKLIINMLLDKKYGVIDDINKIIGVGHRVVHGGEYFVKSVLIDGPDGQVLDIFKKLSDLAPLHNPNNIIGIEASMEYLPHVPQVAIMDTAFLHTLPSFAYRYAVPSEWYYLYGIRKYGFHGTSHLYVSRRASVLLNKKPSKANLITCHIGNGVSFTAIKNGEAFDHSMGFTPLEGLIMGTRSGDIDPAIIEFIAHKKSISIEKIINILNKESGLKGITEHYIDRRDILKEAKNNNQNCQLAINMEVHRIKKYLGAYMSILGNVDAIVFTGGAGEMNPDLREKSLTGLSPLGVIFDKKKNMQAKSHNHEFEINSPKSPVKIFVIPTDEELVLVEDTMAIINGKYDIPSKFKYSFENKKYINKMRNELYKQEKQPFK